MKIMNIKLVAIRLIIFLGLGASIVLAQKNNQDKAKQEDTKSVIAESMNEQGIFRTVSSTEVDSHKGFKIVAVKNFYIFVNNAEDNGKTRKDLVEIELYAKILPLGSAMPDVIQIGDKTFPPSNIGCEDLNHCVKVIMSPKEFKELRANSIISMYQGIIPEPDVLKESYKDGEPNQIMGAKFGRLNKKMIETYPTEEKPATPQKSLSN